jgi:hypothetical protein
LPGIELQLTVPDADQASPRQIGDEVTLAWDWRDGQLLP